MCIHFDIVFEQAQRQQDLYFSAAAGSAPDRKLACAIRVKRRDTLARYR
jgi:hypothetical protein